MNTSSDEIGQHIGVFIKSRRKELGLSLDATAKRCGYSKAHIWQLEQGRLKNPTLKTVLTLCEGLSCSLSDLLGVDVSQPIFTNEELALIAAHRQIFKAVKL